MSLLNLNPISGFVGSFHLREVNVRKKTRRRFRETQRRDQTRMVCVPRTHLRNAERTPGSVGPPRFRPRHPSDPWAGRDPLGGRPSETMFCGRGSSSRITESDCATTTSLIRYTFLRREIQTWGLLTLDQGS